MPIHLTEHEKPRTLHHRTSDLRAPRRSAPSDISDRCFRDVREHRLTTIMVQQEIEIRRTYRPAEPRHTNIEAPSSKTV